jgi:predicted nucleic acid-binding protein
VRAIFADTFYWAALTSTDDAAHERALVLSRSIAPDTILTTDEVLAEYLAFFAGARPSVRAKAGANVANLIENPAVLSDKQMLFHKAGSPFLRAWNSTARGPTRATA